MDETSQKIQEIRNRHFLTQDEFAKALGVSRPTVSDWEQGKRLPTTEQLLKISEVYHVSIDTILQTKSKEGAIVVIDTCVLMNRPRILHALLANETVDQVIVPEVVVSELNYQKDHGRRPQQAWLAMVQVERLHREYPERVEIFRDSTAGRINDQKIMDAARQVALSKCEQQVLLLTDDVYFSIASVNESSFEILLLRDFEERFPVHAEDFSRVATARFFAEVAENSVDGAKKAYNQSVNVNFIDPATGFTPLIRAVRNRCVPMVEFLASLPGLDCNLCDDAKYRLPAICHAVQLNDLNMVKALAENGADVDAQSQGKNRGNTALMIAAWHGRLDIVQYLCECGACENQQDSNGFTALIKACIRKQAPCANFLRTRTDTRVKSLEGLCAMDYAAKAHSPELMKLFKEIK